VCYSLWVLLSGRLAVWQTNQQTSSIKVLRLCQAHQEVPQKPQKRTGF
jgi:hypothetical protein